MPTQLDNPPAPDVSADEQDAAMADTAAIADSADLARTAPLDDGEIRRFAREDADGLVGRQLAHFEVSETLGAGGMGSVYRARDVSLERTVALKVLPADFHEPHLIERFKREARAQARLSHPNVVPIYFIGEQEGRHFFAMELVDGPSLEDMLRTSGALRWQQALEYMVDVARALRQAHQRGLIHRDLKPGNLLLTPEGHVKVADFGLAKPIEEGDGSLTQEGAFLGTPMYIAPEQARGKDVDHRADMYALGATFFHLLAGRPVFSAPTPVALVVKHVSEPPPHIDELVDELPTKFAAVLQRLLAKAPDERFADYDALIAALGAARPRSRERAGFLVRTSAWLVDLVLVMLTAFIHKDAPLVVYPAYMVGAWTWRGSTVAQKLFRIRVTNEDGTPLSLWQAIKRFVAMHWAVGVLALIVLFMRLGLGIDTISIKDTEVTSAGDIPTQVSIVVVMTVTVMLWLLGAVVAVFHPRKKAAHDIMADTTVTYRLGEAP